jgi:mono/diheme cytochrome c family protein
VEDSETWNKPWTGEYTWPATEKHICEYACHEGNYALADILRGARRQEGDEAKAANKRQPVCNQFSKEIRMKGRLISAAIQGAALLIWSAMGAMPAAAAGAPTFSKEIAPILYKNCANCHRPGEIAPMSLLTYEQARPWAKSIREKVLSGRMPPWHATESHGTFANDRRLSDAEKNTLIAWVDAGAPQGDPTDLPPTPKCAERWQIGKPDVVLSIPKPLDVAEERSYRLSVLHGSDQFHGRQIDPGAGNPARRTQRRAPHSRVRQGAGSPRPEARLVSVLPKMPRVPNRLGEGGRPEPAMCLL